MEDDARALPARHVVCPERAHVVGDDRMGRSRGRLVGDAAREVEVFVHFLVDPGAAGLVVVEPDPDVADAVPRVVELPEAVRERPRDAEARVARVVLLVERPPAGRVLEEREVGGARRLGRVVRAAAVGDGRRAAVREDLEGRHLRVVARPRRLRRREEVRIRDRPAVERRIGRLFGAAGVADDVARREERVEARAEEAEVAHAHGDDARAEVFAVRKERRHHAARRVHEADLARRRGRRVAFAHDDARPAVVGVDAEALHGRKARRDLTSPREDVLRERPFHHQARAAVRRRVRPGGRPLRVEGEGGNRLGRAEGHHLRGHAADPAVGATREACARREVGVDGDDARRRVDRDERRLAEAGGGGGEAPREAVRDDARRGGQLGSLVGLDVLERLVRLRAQREEGARRVEGERRHARGLVAEAHLRAQGRVHVPGHDVARRGKGRARNEGGESREDGMRHDFRFHAYKYTSHPPPLCQLPFLSFFGRGCDFSV